MCSKNVEQEQQQPGGGKCIKTKRVREATAKKNNFVAAGKRKRKEEREREEREEREREETR